VLAQVKPTVLGALPIRAIDFGNPQDKTRHDQMVNLVKQRIELKKKLALANTPLEKTSLQRQITANDAQINGLVHELYGLTANEIRTVFGGQTVN